MTVGGFSILDLRCCHATMSDDALHVSKTNVNPGGKQQIMHEGSWNGIVQKMVTSTRVPKGLRVVLEERDVNTHGMNADKMREILREHSDYKYEKSRIEHYYLNITVN